MAPHGTQGQNSAARLKQHHDLGGKSRERGQAAAKTRRQEQPPFRCKIRVRGKEGDGYSDDVATDEIGGQGAGRNRRKVAVENYREVPPQQAADHAAHRYRNERSPHQRFGAWGTLTDRIRQIVIALTIRIKSCGVPLMKKTNIKTDLPGPKARELLARD